MSGHSKTHPLPLIDIAGPPEERGHQYGVKAKPYIHGSIKNYKNIYAKIGISWEQACQKANSFIPKLKKTEHELFTEMRATATGAKVSIEDLLAINCRTEIIYGEKGASQVATDGCTGAIALPAATKQKHVLHGQNWDWLDECADTSIVLRITPDIGPKILTQTEAGNLARCGLNSSGLALTGNFLKCDRDNSPGGIPIPFIRRHILEQTSYSNAIGLILKTPKSFSTNIMLSHGAGEAVNLETIPGDTFWIQPTKDLLVHANHFETMAAQSKIIDEGLKVAPCSLHRRRRVHTHLAAHIGNLNIEHFKTAFADKFDSPFGVCAMPDHGPGGDTSSTVASIIMDVTDKKMWIAPRPYQEHTYTEYSLN